MKLSEVFASNPDAKAEYDQAIADARAAGVESEKARVAALTPFIMSEAYDGAFKAQVMKGIAGEYTVETVKAMAGMEDARIEREKSSAAKAETKETGDTRGEQHEMNTTGLIESEADIVAINEQMKGAF